MEVTDYVSFGMVSLALVFFYSACGAQRHAFAPVVGAWEGEQIDGWSGSGAVPTVKPGGFDGSAALDDQELLFLELLNAYRKDSGMEPLSVSVALTRASDWMSMDMAEKGYFSHTDSLGHDPFYRMDEFGYTGATAKAENIAAGNGAAKGTFDQWKNSPGHNINMLSDSYRSIGIARHYQEGSPYGWYWTTDFGSE